MSPVHDGSIIPAKWSPLRAEIERQLADGAWHELDVVYWRVERFIDPRIAARMWTRMYDRNTAKYEVERDPASTAFVTHQQEALEYGRRRVFWDTIRPLIHRRKRIQLDEWNGRRRIRLVESKEG